MKELAVVTVCIVYRALVVGIVLLMCSCHPTPAPAPAPAPSPAPQPAPLGDAGPTDACSKACAHLRALGCADGSLTAAGDSCEIMCRHDAAGPSAMLTPAYLGCLATMARCSDEELCAR